jgi:hypothetical protein
MHDGVPPKIILSCSYNYHIKQIADTPTCNTSFIKLTKRTCVNISQILSIPSSHLPTSSTTVKSAHLTTTRRKLAALMECIQHVAFQLSHTGNNSRNTSFTRKEFDLQTTPCFVTGERRKVSGLPSLFVCLKLKLIIM